SSRDAGQDRGAQPGRTAMALALPPNNEAAKECRTEPQQYFGEMQGVHAVGSMAQRCTARDSKASLGLILLVPKALAACFRRPPEPNPRSRSAPGQRLSAIWQSKGRTFRQHHDDEGGKGTQNRRFFD